jgi:hypothetical protein
MTYRRAINQRLTDTGASAAEAAEEDPALVVRCWPSIGEETLPRVVQRNGQPVLDGGWEEVDDDPAAEDA